ncbi:MAG: hypothetical protein QOE60_1178 [Thermoleophilaceae bacterium]|nr:hypothetical protein [Thermoleophilaceae bacterium]
MLIVHLILAGLAVGVIALDATSTASAACVATLAGAGVLLGSPLGPALHAALPVLVFLAAALTLATAAGRAGLAVRAADRMARLARGSTPRLYALVCGATALMTAVVSLDGAVVLIVPLLLALARRHGAPLAPLLLGTVAVANAASIVVPQGNPTNLVVIERLEIAPIDFVGQMLVPGLVGAFVCGAGAALLERRALTAGYAVPADVPRAPLSRAERQLIVALAAAGLVAWLAPLLGISPCWPFAAIAAGALLLHPHPRPRPAVPVRLAVQLIGLLVLIGSLHLEPTGSASLFVVAGAVSVVAALANNLPASVSVGSLLAGPSAYAATIGLGVGALAAPQGSVATLLAAELAGPDAPPLRVSRLAPLALAGVAAATIALHA